MDWGQLDLVDGELQLTPEVRLLPTPGHTPGHMIALIESQGQTAIYLGDVCHLPVHFSHPDWTSTFDTCPEITPRTRAWLFDLALARQALLICPHAPSPGMGHLEKTPHGVRWQPLT
jgi:glyoxylase-like metal-dependent hydrolase (beta-lactamase superfamily II)